MNGVILIDKPENYTSRDIVNIVSKITNIKKVGHTGTLDPLATGVLAVCVGEGTKLVETLMCDNKIYEAEITLGIETDTLDNEGKEINRKNTSLSKKEIEESLKQMIGTYNQEVPAYSAVKVNGKKLYEYARNGEDVILPKHKVTIFSLELISDIKYKENLTIFKIRTHVSKGTYIRSLVRDIAIKLNTIGVMSSLRRIQQGNFTIEMCNTLEDIKNNKYKIISLEEILKDEYIVNVNGYFEKMIKNGRIIENRYNKDIVVFKNDKKIIAIYKKDNLDSTKMRVFKMFNGGE